MSPDDNKIEDEEDDTSHSSLVRIDPIGFHLRPPPAPHDLSTFITPDSALFEAIHMGSAVIDVKSWRLVIDGLVSHPVTLSLPQLLAYPPTTITAFHECYGSPLKPPTTALWRIGNVTWTGVQLRTLLNEASPLDSAKYIWSEGLDHGAFGGRQVDRYQKDLPLVKAQSEEVLLAYAMNGEPLRKERGGPVRLIVPGWFGTNMTKWLCRISVQAQRARGPYTTVWYNEPEDLTDPGKGMRPVWAVLEPNSLITKPRPGEVVQGPEVDVSGWAWCCEEVKCVGVRIDGVEKWTMAEVEGRVGFSWQCFRVKLRVGKAGRMSVMARAEVNGVRQPLSGRRNHVHCVEFEVIS